MLQTLSKHSLIDVKLNASGDLRHHVVEDVGIALGLAVDRALGGREGVRRFGYAIVPMDEALALAAVDLARRPRHEIALETRLEVIEDIPVSEIVHFLESMATNMQAAIHVKVLAGADDHHKVEAAFKALAVALRNAVEKDPRATAIPSTKGVL
jgi:imidazoleglycerol-phosphate dehydratase